MSHASHRGTGLLAPSREDRSDAELISQVRGGDVDAYGDLFSRHRGAAERLARQLVQGADVDDLVSEAFAKVLNVLLGGGGPDVAFRAYLLTAVRRLHVDRIRATNKATPTDDLEPYDAGVPFSDTVIAGFEGSAAAKAFASLPERWQLVLWHLEVEGNKPADVAPLLGMTPNSVSALAYRAREGLRQAFLQMHTAELAEDECRWTRGKLGAYVRNGLSRRDSHKVDEHLDGCRKCTAIFLELGEINSELAGLIGPIILGGAAAAYLSGGGASGAAGASTGILGGLWDKSLGWAQGVPSAVGGHVAVIGGATAVGVATVATLAVVATQGPDQVRTTTDPQRPGVSVPVAPPKSEAPAADPDTPPVEEPESTGEPATPAIALSAEDGTTAVVLPVTPEETSTDTPPESPLTAPILPTEPEPAPEVVAPEEPVAEEPVAEEPGETPVDPDEGDGDTTGENPGDGDQPGEPNTDPSDPGDGQGGDPDTDDGDGQTGEDPGNSDPFTVIELSAELDALDASGNNASGEVVLVLDIKIDLTELSSEQLATPIQLTLPPGATFSPRGNLPSDCNVSRGNLNTADCTPRLTLGPGGETTLRISINVQKVQDIDPNTNVITLSGKLFGLLDIPEDDKPIEIPITLVGGKK